MLNTPPFIYKIINKRISNRKIKKELSSDEYKVFLRLQCLFYVDLYLRALCEVSNLLTDALSAFRVRLLSNSQLHVLLEIAFLILFGDLQRIVICFPFFQNRFAALSDSAVSFTFGNISVDSDFVEHCFAFDIFMIWKNIICFCTVKVICFFR